MAFESPGQDFPRRRRQPTHRGSFGRGLAGRRFVTVRPEEPGSTRGELVYDVTKSVPLVPGFIVNDALPILWTDRSVVTCLDAATGNVHWLERVDGDFYSSLLWIEGRPYGISKRGEVVVLEAGETFAELGRGDLGEKTFATPAVADGVMYLRTQTRLFALGNGE